MELLVGTTNLGKLLEIETYLRNLPVKIASLSRFAWWPQIIEDGDSYEANALKKARSLADFSGLLTLADDSGLEVAALGGQPGIHSARYAGEENNDRRNNEKLLRALAGVPGAQRNARFVCVLALCTPLLPQRREWVFRGECEGWIEFARKGDRGFGYDPLFFYPPLGKTFGELVRDTKSQVSHRGKALKSFSEAFPRIMDRGIYS